MDVHGVSVTGDGYTGKTRVPVFCSGWVRGAAPCWSHLNGEYRSLGTPFGHVDLAILPPGYTYPGFARGCQLSQEAASLASAEATAQTARMMPITTSESVMGT